MKIEISPDQNILTISRATFQAEPAVPKSPCLKCYFASWTDKGCLNPLVNHFCNPEDRNDNQDIVWVRKYEN